jgi:PAS domain S-box-containing protein
VADGTKSRPQQGDLAAREQELAAIYQHVPGIVFYVSVEPDDHFRFLSMSDAGLIATGLRRDQVIGRSVQDVIPPPSGDVVLAHYRTAIRSGRTERWREVSVYPAGRRVADVAVTPLYDARGTATHLIGIVHDITEREHLEETLQHREARMRLALNACGGGSWTWDATTNILDWDDGFRARYGFTAGEPPAFDSWISRVIDEDRPPVLALLQEMLHTTRESWDNTFRIVHPDGSVRWIESLGRAERAADGQVTRLTGLELDVTAQRQAEEAILARRDEDHHRELRLLLETATQGIVSVDEQGQILTANHTLEQMFGWGPGELIGRPIERLVPRSVRQQHVLHRTRYAAAPRPRVIGGGLELSGERKDGSTFSVEVSLNHVDTASGGHTIAFVTDTTERKRAITALHERTAELEQRTAQLQRMASQLTLAEQHAREQLAKTLHDGLQQQLTVAAMTLESIERRASMARPSIDQVHEAQAQLADAIVTARSLSVELYPPVLHAEGLPAAVRWLADWHRTKYGLDVRVTADPLANATRRDMRILLFESVRELLFNVVKHAHVQQVAVNLAIDEHDALSITVTDEGIGFDETRLRDRTKSGDAGWGLLSIRERLTLLGGRFEIHSRPGEGAQFHLTAPQRGADLIIDTEPPTVSLASAPMCADAAAVPSLRALRILIADDHAGVRIALRRTLQAYPEFDIVGDAADGVEALREARVLQPDVILMDISMPRMDGVEATRRLHAEFPDMQILGLSMYAGADGGRAIQEAGAVGFYQKGMGTKFVIDHLLALHAKCSGTTAS